MPSLIPIYIKKVCSRVIAGVVLHVNLARNTCFRHLQPPIDGFITQVHQITVIDNPHVTASSE